MTRQEFCPVLLIACAVLMTGIAAARMASRLGLLPAGRPHGNDVLSAPLVP